MYISFMGLVEVDARHRPAVRKLFLYNILHPDALFHQHKADGAFDDVHTVDEQIDRNDIQPGKAGQAVGQRDRDSPGKAAVKQEGDKGLTAGPQRKIRTVGKTVQRHAERRHADQLGCQQADGFLGIINARDIGRAECQQRPHDNAAGKAQGDHAPGRAARPGQPVGTQLLPDNDGRGVAQREEHLVEDLGDGVADVQRGYCLNAAHRVALQQHGLPGTPHQLVGQQRRGADQDVPHQRAGDRKAAIDAPQEGVAVAAAVGTHHHDSQLHKAGQHRGNGSAGHAHARERPYAEDEQRIEDKVHDHGQHTGLHGQHGLAAFTQGARIALGQAEGHKPDEHNAQIPFGILQGRGGVRRGGIRRDIGTYKRGPCGEKQPNGCRCDGKRHQQLEPEGVTHALHISTAVELRAEDACARGAAPDRQIVDEQQLAHYGNAAHRQRADLPDHDIVEQGHHICQGVLYDDRQNDHQHMPVKCAVADQTFPQRQFFRFFHTCSFFCRVRSIIRFGAQTVNRNFSHKKV